MRHLPRRPHGTRRRPWRNRRGGILVLAALLLVLVCAMVAFAIDVGQITVAKRQLQNAADIAALAAASQLPDRDALQGVSNQSREIRAARREARRLAKLNRAGGKTLDTLPAARMRFGYLSAPGGTAPLDTKTTPYNAATVQVERSTQANGPLSLFFAPVIGTKTSNVSASATAMYEGNIRGFKITPKSPQTLKVIPFALDIDLWKALVAGSGPDTWSYNPKTKAYTPGSDGIKEVNLYPASTGSGGNFGTVDIGNTNNNPNDIIRQLRYGPNQNDLNQHGGQLALDNNGKLLLNGDTGINGNLEGALQSIRGEPRIIPLYKAPVVGSGNRSTYTIVGFAGIVILDAKIKGPSKRVIIQPEYVFDGTAVGGGKSSSSWFVYRPLQLAR